MSAMKDTIDTPRLSRRSAVKAWRKAKVADRLRWNRLQAAAREIRLAQVK
jgi:hypothetical protein